MSTAAVAAAPSSVTGAAVPLDHLSFSSLRTFSLCPRKFSYRYIEHAPEECVPSSLAFGGSFHKAAEFLHQARLEAAPTPTIEVLLDVYDQGWRETTAKAPEVQYGKSEDAASLRELAGRMLSVYRQHVSDTADQTTGSQIIAIEHAHRFRLLADVPPIEMRVDLLELCGDGELRVTDIKTSRSKYSEQKISESLPQLVLYAHGLMPILRELGAKKIVPSFQVITKAKKPIVQTLEPQATQADAERLKQMVGDTWRAIQSGLDMPRESWACASCPYRRRCGR